VNLDFGEESVKHDDPHKRIVGSPQPPIFHFGVDLLGNQQPVDQVGLTGAQIAVTRAPTIMIGADADGVAPPMSIQPLGDDCRVGLRVRSGC
jgi:hypothetical protein